MENKPVDECSFYTFNRFYDRFKISTNRTESWETIVRYYQQLWEWYKDFNLYHQIGYLVAIGYSIKDLLDIAMNKNNPVRKSEFKEKILMKIRQSVKIEDIDYADLSYEYHYNFIHILLLLFNVETIRQKGDEDNRFPFERYKNEGTWSLEHIHAQNSENLKTNREWRDWLVLHKHSLKNLIKTYEENSSEYLSISIIIDNIDKQCVIFTKDLLRYDRNTEKRELDFDKINQLSCSVYRIQKAPGYDEEDLSTIRTITERIK